MTGEYLFSFLSLVYNHPKIIFVKHIIALIFFCLSFSFVSAQLKDVLIKDSVAFLMPHLKASIGTIVFYEKGVYDHENRYYMKEVVIKDCMLKAIVNMTVSNTRDTSMIRYTLYYTIPLGDVAEIATTNKTDSTRKYFKAPLFFTTVDRKLSIYHKMVEDHTDRVEGEGYFSEAFLWRISHEREQVITVLKDLCKKCAVK